MQRLLDEFLVDTDQQGPVLREWLSAACAPSHDVVRRLVDACARAVDFGETEDDRKNIGAAWRAGRRELLQRVRADEQSMSRLHRWVLNLARCPDVAVVGAILVIAYLTHDPSRGGVVATTAVWAARLSPLVAYPLRQLLDPLGRYQGRLPW
ncbi:hypothetical protein ABPG77_009743 [Micractinium sp. CCAP 211/92]